MKLSGLVVSGGVVQSLHLAGQWVDSPLRSQASGLSLNPPSHDCTRERCQSETKVCTWKIRLYFFQIPPPPPPPFVKHMIAVGDKTRLYKRPPRTLWTLRAEGRTSTISCGSKDEDLHPLCVRYPASCHHW